MHTIHLYYIAPRRKCLKMLLLHFKESCIAMYTSQFHNSMGIPKKEEYKEMTVFHKQRNKNDVKTTCDPAKLSQKTV